MLNAIWMTQNHFEEVHKNILILSHYGLGDTKHIQNSVKNLRWTFPKTVNDWKPITALIKFSIFDVWQGSAYVYVTLLPLFWGGYFRNLST